jgi:hypothetical protein
MIKILWHQKSWIPKFATFIKIFGVKITISRYFPFKEVVELNRETCNMVSLLRPTSWTKCRQILKSFPPCYSKSPLQLWLEISISSKLTQPLTVSTVQLLYTVKKAKWENLLENHTPLTYSLRNPYRNLKSENSQDYVQKPQRNCMFMNK